MFFCCILNNEQKFSLRFMSIYDYNDVKMNVKVVFMSENLKVKIIVSEDIVSQNVNNQTSNLIINPVYVLRAPFVPTALSLGITIVTAGLETGKNHEIEISVLNTKLNESIYTTGTNLVLVPSGVDNFNFSLDLKNLPFMNIGEYIINLKVDGSEFSDTFMVKANQILGQ